MNRWGPKGLLLLLGATAALAGPVIVVDPGHGGSQDGAVGPRGAQEKAIALQIAQKLRTELEHQLGAKVILTREKDELLPLAQRVSLANQAKPDLFISIHANSMPTRSLRARIEGVETFFVSATASDEDAQSLAARENAEPAQDAAAATPQDTLAFILTDLTRTEEHADASRLAYAVHSRLVSSLPVVDRGVQQAPFYVLMGVQAPAILVEVGFISHPDEAKRLRDSKYQWKMARAISRGVGDFLDQVERRDGTATRLSAVVPTAAMP